MNRGMNSFHEPLHVWPGTADVSSMRESELLGAVDAAELVAPILDRLRLSVASAVRERASAMASFGLSWIRAR